MPINIPKLAELRDRVKTDIEARLNISIPIFGKNFLFVLCGVIGAKLKLMYNMIHFVNQNITPDTASSELLGGTLERWGRLKLNRNPFKATAGIYTIEVTGTIGAIINEGQVFRSKETSTSPNNNYVTDSQYILTGTNQNIQVRALNTGLESVLNIGDKLIYSSPIVGVNQDSEVVIVDTYPIDSESLEDYKLKVIQSFRLEPNGGSHGDYRIWGFDAQGIRAVYPYATSGEESSITVYAEAENTSTTINGVPTSQMLLNLADVFELDPDTTKPINERGRRPVTVLNLYCLPIFPSEVVITIVGFVGLNATLEGVILNTIKEYISTVRPFIAGADVLADINDTLTTNNLIFEIQNVIPKTTRFSNLLFTVNGVSQTSFLYINGNIPFVNTINYI